MSKRAKTEVAAANPLRASITALMQDAEGKPDRVASILMGMADRALKLGERLVAQATKQAERDTKKAAKTERVKERLAKMRAKLEALEAEAAKA